MLLGLIVGSYSPFLETLVSYISWCSKANGISPGLLPRPSSFPISTFHPLHHCYNQSNIWRSISKAKAQKWLLLPKMSLPVMVVKPSYRMLLPRVLQSNQSKHRMIKPFSWDSIAVTVISRNQCGNEDKCEGLKRALLL